jgi:hypothetical protein
LAVFTAELFHICCRALKNLHTQFNFIATQAELRSFERNLEQPHAIRALLVFFSMRAVKEIERKDAYQADSPLVVSFVAPIQACREVPQLSPFRIESLQSRAA